MSAKAEISFYDSTHHMLRKEMGKILDNLVDVEDPLSRKIHHNPLGDITCIDNDGEKRIKKLSYLLLNREPLCCNVSQSFIEKQINNWLLDTYNNVETFSSYIERQIIDSKSEYQFFFPIISACYCGKDLHYAILSDVTFETIPPQHQEYFECITDNTVYACTKVYGEFEYAKQVAFDKCSFAIDVFKICSKLSWNTRYKRCEFDIDNKNLSREYSSYVAIKSNTSNNKEFCFGGKRDKTITDLDSKLLDSVKERSIALFQNLYNESLREDCPEDVILLKETVRCLSASISEINPDKQIVSLCSIFDRLILTDRQKKIVATLKKYVPIIISEDGEQRKMDEELVETMYKYRSEYIHRGIKHCEITYKDLINYRAKVFLLIRNLIRLLDKYRSFDNIYKSIDVQIDLAVRDIKIN